MGFFLEWRKSDIRKIKHKYLKKQNNEPYKHRIKQTQKTKVGSQSWVCSGEPGLWHVYALHTYVKLIYGFKIMNTVLMHLMSAFSQHYRQL